MNLIEELKRTPLPKELAFPASEYARRVRETQKRMVEGGIDILLVASTPNLCYLTGYDSVMTTGYATGVLGTTGDIELHCSELEAPCALLFSTIEKISVFYWFEGMDTATQLAQVLKERGADGMTIGLEMGKAETFASGAFDTRSYLRLRELLPQANFVDATRLVLGLRLIKSAPEIAYMRRAGTYTAIGHEAAFGAAAEGRTDNEVVAAGYAAMIAAGSELMSIDPIIHVGPRAAYMPHIPYKRAKIRRGDTVFLEFSGCHERYNAPSMRTAVVGAPPDGVERLADAAIATVELLLENIRPGRTGDDVAKAAKRGLEGAPEGTYWHEGYGYAIGMGMQPTWTENPVYIAERCEVELRPGMTFHLPICLCVPRDKYGVGFSESVVVTEQGCELLTPGKDRVLVRR